MKKFIVGSAVAASAFCFGLGAASAATPAVQACVGSTVSPLAATSVQSVGPGAFGQAIGSFAQNSSTPGFGLEIQGLQAGLAPDTLVANTCND